MLNEQKITYRMKTLMESGFFGTKSLLSEAFQNKDKVRLFQAAYNYTYDKNLAVDGIKGGQTNAAIADVKKQLGKEKLDNDGAKDFYQKFLVKLDENKGSINVGQGGANTNKILNQAIQALINLAGTPLGIDGVIGTKTLAAIKTVTEDSEVINAENITTITGKAAENILELGVEDIAAVQGGAATGANATGTEGGTKSKYGTCLSGDCANGQGKLKNTENNIYIGTFVDYYHTGKNNEIQLANGNIFKGETLKGKPVKGTLSYKSGGTFTGDFYPNSFTLKYGTFRHKDGWIYTGGFNAEGKMDGSEALYINTKGKQWRLSFSAGNPIGETWKSLDELEDDGKMTISADVVTKRKKQAFNAELKKVIEVVKTYPVDKQKGSYELYRGASFRVINYSNKLILSSVNIFSDLKNISSSGKWVYNPSTNSISFDNGKYVYKA